MSRMEPQDTWYDGDAALVSALWEPSWEPFGVDRGGRVWTLVETKAYG